MSSVLFNFAREYLTTFRYRPSFMSSVIQFSKIVLRKALGLPKPDRKLLFFSVLSP